MYTKMLTRTEQQKGGDGDFNHENNAKKPAQSFCIFYQCIIISRE